MSTRILIALICALLALAPAALAETTGGVADASDMTDVIDIVPEGMEPVTPIPWTPDQVFAMADAIVKDEESRKRRSGTHSAYLWKGGELLCCCEDIGRHNALDKVIGSALMRGTDLSRCALFTSGRVPTDMVAKVVRSRVPLLVSKACATDKTVAAARAYNLTLVCNASRDSMDVFNDPMR